jgi:hypothetical protein
MHLVTSVGVPVYFWTMESYRQPSGFFLSI